MTKIEKKVIFLTIINFIVLTIGMFILTNVVGSSYQDIEHVNTTVFFEIAITVILVLFYRKNLTGSSFNKVEKLPFKTITSTLFSILFVTLIFAVVSVFATAKYADKNMVQLLILIIAMLFVSIAEELMFRGIVLQAFLEKRGKVKVVLLSSVLFGLLHIVNIIGGGTVEDVFMQIVTASFVGILFACIALEIKNIVPLIIYHWLWNSALLSSKYLQISGGYLIQVLAVMQAVFSIIVLIRLTRKTVK